MQGELLQKHKSLSNLCSNSATETVRAQLRTAKCVRIKDLLSSLRFLQPDYIYRKIWFAEDWLPLEGSWLNVLPWGHHSPNLWLPYPQTALLFPSVLEPSLFYNPFPSSQPFYFLLQYLQSPEVNMLSGAPRETIWLSNLCSTGVGASRAAGQFHGHIRSSSSQLQVQEDYQQNYCTKAMMNTVLWESGGATISGAALKTSASLEALRRPWNTWTSHSFGFKAFSAKSLWESPKEGELLPLLLQLASQFPQNVQRYHLTIIFQLPPYLQGRRPPGKAAAPQHGNAEVMVKTLLSEPAPCLSHQPPEPFNKLPIQDSICPFIL